MDPFDDDVFSDGDGDDTRDAALAVISTLFAGASRAHAWALVQLWAHDLVWYVEAFASESHVVPNVSRSRRLRQKLAPGRLQFRCGLRSIDGAADEDDPEPRPNCSESLHEILSPQPGDHEIAQTHLDAGIVPQCCDRRIAVGDRHDATCESLEQPLHRGADGFFVFDQ